jgi:hypothetical protein
VSRIHATGPERITAAVGGGVRPRRVGDAVRTRPAGC